MTLAEGGGKRAVMHKMRDMYVPTLKANYLIWPAVQILNFRVVPIQFQLVSLVEVMVFYAEFKLTCQTSRSYPPSELPGQHTSRFQTLRRMSWRPVPCPVRPNCVCSKVQMYNSGALGFVR